MTKKPYTSECVRLNAVAFKPSYAETDTNRARIVFVSDQGQQVDMPAKSKVAKEAVAMTSEGVLLGMRGHNFIVVCERMTAPQNPGDSNNLRAVAVHRYPQWPEKFSTAFLPERQRELKDQKELVLKIYINPETFAMTVLEYPQVLLRAQQVKAVLTAIDEMKEIVTGASVGTIGKILSFEEGTMRVKYTGKVAQAAGVPAAPEFAEDTVG